MTGGDPTGDDLAPEGAPEDEAESAEAEDTPRAIEPTFDPKMLEALVCPQTRAVLSYDAARQELVSKRAALAYPIRGGIPVLLIDEARSIDD